MSGILDNKSRVMDTIVTLEGRRRIARGDLKIEYVSFSDGATYYKGDVASGSADATNRLYFESCHLPQDQITFEADDSGRLNPFSNDSNVILRDGQLVAYEFDDSEETIVSGSNQGMRILSGDEFASTADDILQSSLGHFTNLRLIGSKDTLFEDDGFGVGNTNIQFTITNQKPLPDQTNHAVNITSLESLFQDIRLSRHANFKYLPPINRLDDDSIDKTDHRNTWKSRLGNYKPWGRTDLSDLKPRQLEFELAHYERMGCSKTIAFDPTSMNNRLVGQMFEVNFDVMKKLDIIEYGRYVWLGKQKHVFFAGKIMTDDNGTNTFVHIFTLMFG